MGLGTILEPAEWKAYGLSLCQHVPLSQCQQTLKQIQIWKYDLLIQYSQ